MLLTLVGFYLVVSVAIGLVAARQVHSTSDYITAGRHLPMPVVLAMVFGLGTWLILEFSGAELLVEPQLVGLLFSAVGMVVGSLIAPGDRR
ncbi:MAG: hypothetical protein O2997_02075 [Proteobacteria bacterium]|nr:hypothetical protein [Pseudomonadota bacterium]